MTLAFGLFLIGVASFAQASLPQGHENAVHARSHFGRKQGATRWSHTPSRLANARKLHKPSQHAVHSLHSKTSQHAGVHHVPAITSAHSSLSKQVPAKPALRSPAKSVARPVTSGQVADATALSVHNKFAGDVTSHEERALKAAALRYDKNADAVKALDRLRPDVSVEFRPEPPDSTGGVWDFDGDDDSFATPVDPDPMVTPLGLISPSRGEALRVANLDVMS